MVLTGVSRPGQVGPFVARALAADGARVVLIDRGGDGSAARAAELVADGMRATAYGCDLADADDAVRVAAHVDVEHPDGVDALVMMAGGWGATGPLDASDPELWHRQIAINLTTAYTATRAFLPALRRRRGSLVYFASESVLPGSKVAETAAYAAAKSGVVALMRAVAQGERSNGVRANALAPTAMRTADNMASIGEKARYVELDAVADAVRFLSGAASRAVTGQVIELRG